MLRLLAAVVLLNGTAFLTAQVRPSELEVVVEAARSVVDAADGVRFKVTLRNIGSAPLLLNGGALLGNGRQGWSAVTCEFRSTAGASVPLGLHWQMGGVAGRVYFLGVPLRAGDSHTLAVTTADYYLATPLRPGRYQLRCTITGKQSGLRDDTQLPACWEGVATSKAVPIEITSARQTDQRPRRSRGRHARSGNAFSKALSKVTRGHADRAANSTKSVSYTDTPDSIARSSAP